MARAGLNNKHLTNPKPSVIQLPAARREAVFLFTGTGQAYRQIFPAGMSLNYRIVRYSCGGFFRGLRPVFPFITGLFKPNSPVEDHPVKEQEGRGQDDDAPAEGPAADKPGIMNGFIFC